MTFTVEFQGAYSNYETFISDYRKMSRKIENLPENRSFILLDDDTFVLCGKIAKKDQVYIIDASAKDTEEGRAHLLELAEKLGV